MMEKERRRSVEPNFDMTKTSNSLSTSMDDQATT